MHTSIRKRFAFTVGANLLRALLSFTSGMLLARWLGPDSFGNMAFLLGTFLGIRQLLDMGSSSAFFTFLSQRPRSKRFIRSFYIWLTAQFLIPLFVIGLLFPKQWIEIIWHGENLNLILLAFAAAFMQNSAWPIVQQAGESQRQTIWVQGIGVIVMGMHLLAVVLLWYFGILGLYAIFLAIALEYLIAAIVAHHRFKYISEDKAGTIDSPNEKIFRIFFRYCLPLIPYAWIAFGYEFADRWLLQNFGGSVEQAYYTVGAQFAGIALIATSSILRIFWKEIAEAHHREDPERTGKLYKKVSRLLFLVGAMIAGFFVPWAKELLQQVLGAAYIGGATTLAIMFLYPVHQSMGQIGGTMLLATERVSTHVVIGIIFMIASMGVSYLVLAPGDAFIPGFNLASEGLAIKMIVMQLIQVNVMAYIIARSWNWPFDWVYQPVSLLGCIFIGWLAYFLVNEIIGNAFSVFVVMGFGGLVYIMLMTGFLYTLPWLAGLSREEFVMDSRKILQKIKITLKK